jgi:hypothetical protein
LNKTEKQKMLAGELYRPDAELGADQAATKQWLVRYNAALALPVSERHKLLSERFARVGSGAVVADSPTFSAFSIQTFNLLRDGENLRAFAYIFASGSALWRRDPDRTSIFRGMTVRT